MSNTHTQHLWDVSDDHLHDPARTRAFLFSASPTYSKSTCVNCWQSACAVSLSTDCSIQRLTAWSFSPYTKLCAGETKIQGMLCCCSTYNNIIFSWFPLIPLNLQVPLHSYRYFPWNFWNMLDAVFINYHDEISAGKVSVSIHHATLDHF